MLFGGYSAGGEVDCQLMTQKVFNNSGYQEKESDLRIRATLVLLVHFKLVRKFLNTLSLLI